MMKTKLSFFLLFLVMHSENALSACFEIAWIDSGNDRNYILYDSDKNVFIGIREIDPNTNEAIPLFQVIRAIVRDMLDTQVTFSREALPRSRAFDRAVEIDGRSLDYSFTVLQSLEVHIAANRDRYYAATESYRAIFTLQNPVRTYEIESSAELPEIAHENPVQAEITVPENSQDNEQYILQEWRASRWTGMFNSFIKLLNPRNSR